MSEWNVESANWLFLVAYDKIQDGRDDLMKKSFTFLAELEGNTKKLRFTGF